MKKTVLLKGLDCAACSAALNTEISKLPGVSEASLDFTTGKLFLQSSMSEAELMEAVGSCIARNDPEVSIVSDGNAYAEGGRVPREQFVQYVGLGLSAVVFALSFFFETPWVKLTLCIASWAFSGFKVLWKALGNIFRGKLMDETLLMSIATIGAFAIGDYPEGAAVMLFYNIGELVQEKAVDRSRKLIGALMELKSDHANLMGEEGIVSVPPEQVEVGQRIIVKPGERLPLDGVVSAGSTYLDTAALTGESEGVYVSRGSHVLSGSVNTSGVIEVEVEKVYADSTLKRVLDLVENAAAKKAVTEKFITRFSRWYTPAVVGLALLVALAPPILFAESLKLWLGRALVLLVVSCPCALVVSIPLSFSAGIGAASKMGVLLKGGTVLEKLAKCTCAVFDKTGTLTSGVFGVSDIVPSEGHTRAEVLELAAMAERYSTHPLAKAITEAYEGALPEAGDYEELSGRGVSAVCSRGKILAGKAELMPRGAKLGQCAGSVVYIALGEEYIGCIALEDTVKTGSREALHELSTLGFTRMAMLTGDRQASAELTAKKLGMSEYYAALLPEDKLQKVEELQKENRGVLFVGDGINDAPVIAQSDVGVAMGAIGSDAAIEAADVVLVKDDITALPQVIRLARHTKTILYENIIGALGIKALVIVMSIAGFSSMWLAVFADVGVALLAILNAARLLRWKKK